MEISEKFTLSTATAHVSISNGLCKFRVVGVATARVMSQLQDRMLAHRGQYVVMMGDYSAAEIAYFADSPWINYHLQMVAGVLVRDDQLVQMRSIARARAAQGGIRRVFTDAMECEFWARGQVLLVRAMQRHGQTPDSLAA